MQHQFFLNLLRVRYGDVFCGKIIFWDLWHVKEAKDSNYTSPYALIHSNTSVI